MRQRIVINLDAPGGSAPPRPQVAGGKRRRWPKVVAILGGLVLFFVIVVLVAGFLGWRRYQSTPTYTLTLLADAAQRNDVAEFQKRIDGDEIAKNMVPSISEKAAARYGLALGSSMRERIDQMLPSLLPRIKQTINDEVVKEINGFAAASEPRSFFSLLVTVPSLVKVTTEGDIAKATAAISDRTIELTMKRDAERWKVTDLKDDVMVQRIVDSVMKELPAIGTGDPNSQLFKNFARGKRGRRAQNRAR